MFYGLAGVVSLLLSLFCWWSYTGPFRLVANLQSSLWGVNFVYLSLLVSWAVLYAPLHALVSVAERRVGVKRDPVAWTRLVALFNFFFESRPGKLAGVGLIFFCMGGWLWGNAMTCGPLTTLTMSQVEQGERLPSRYVRLTDVKILLKSKLTYTRDTSVERYFPVTSTQGNADRVRVFARLDESDLASPPKEIVGEVEFDGLPGPFRDDLAEKDLLAPDYFVVRHGSNPASGAFVAAWMAGLGAMLFAAGMVWWKARSARADRSVLRPRRTRQQLRSVDGSRSTLRS